MVEFMAMLKEQEHSEAALAAEHAAARTTSRGSVLIRQHLPVEFQGRDDVKLEQGQEQTPKLGNVFAKAN